MTERAVDEEARYAIFRKRDGKCHHCGARLKWEEFGVRGRSGSWVLELPEAEDDENPAQALCYRCLDFPGRSKAGKLWIISEP